MTENQLRYMELMQQREKWAADIDVARGTLGETERHNRAVESETGRHNLAVEDQALRELNLGWYNAGSQRITAEANKRNADSNARNAATNERNADINAYNAYVNWYNAESNRMNAQTNRAKLDVDWFNAYSGRMTAQANQMQGYAAMQNANTNWWSAQRNYYLGYENLLVNRSQANTAYQRMLSDAELNQSYVQSNKTLDALRTAQTMNTMADTKRVHAQTEQSQAQTRYLNTSEYRERVGAARDWQAGEMYGINNALSQTANFMGSMLSGTGAFMRGYGSMLGAQNQAAYYASQTQQGQDRLQLEQAKYWLDLQYYKQKYGNP